MDELNVQYAVRSTRYKNIMSQKTVAVKVGVVFLIGILILGALTFLAGNIRLFKGGYSIKVYFNSVSGLEQGNKVRLAGVKVGEVRSLRFSGNKVEVVLWLEPRAEVNSDAKIGVSATTLIGGRHIDIIPGTPGYPLLSEGSCVEGTDPVDINEILSESKKISRGVNEIMGFVNESQEKVGETLSSIKRIVEKVEKGEGTLGKLINEEEFHQTAKESVVLLKQTSQKAQVLLDKFDRLRTFLGYNGEYNFEEEKARHRGYLRISPAPDKYYLLGVSKLGTSGDEEEAEEVEEEEKYEVKFDLLLAGTFKEKITLRAGVIESEGGAGIDYELAKRGIRFSMEGRSSDFSDPFFLRFRFQYRIWKNCFITAGVEDILDEPGVLAGIRLEYEDNDLKYLIGALGVAR